MDVETVVSEGMAEVIKAEVKLAVDQTELN